MEMKMMNEGTVIGGMVTVVNQFVKNIKMARMTMKMMMEQKNWTTRVMEKTIMDSLN
jgi:hypothetical protein